MAKREVANETYCMGTAKFWHSPQIRWLIVVAVSLVHLSLVPGPSADFSPAWLGNWSLHLAVYAALSLLIILESLRYSQAVLELAIGNFLPLILLGLIVAILTGAVPVRTFGPDIVSVLVPGLLGGTWVVRREIDVV